MTIGQSYWDEAAGAYDEAFTHTLIGRAERAAVWRELVRLFHPGDRVLELNCGTGYDAVFLAERGVRVLGCDLSPRMIDLAGQRLRSTNLEALVEFRVLATEDILGLGNSGPFDGVFSNFAGLNCVQDLSRVARSLALLLKSGAPALFCMSGRFVPMEVCWHLAHGDFRKALRRFTLPGIDGRETDDARVKVCYHAVGSVAEAFRHDFRFVGWRGIGVAMPPAYFEHWARRLPGIFTGLARADRWLGRIPVLRGMAGHALMQFERIEADPQTFSTNR